jgi:hypothetical protein
MFLRILICVVVFMAPNTLFANWRYTQWTMTQDEVQRAASGKATILSLSEQAANSSAESNEVALLQAPYASGKYDFTAVFSFDKRTNKLASVKLNLNNKDKAAELLGSLRAKYGTPSSEKHSPILSYATWYKDGDQISYMTIGDTTVSVDYKPRETADNDGL